MELVVNKADLLEELTLAASIVERRTTIPVLANVKLEAADGQVKITATDLEVGLKSFFPAEVSVPGTVLLPAKDLYGYISELDPSEPIKVKVTANGAYFTSGRNRTRINVDGSDNYPELPTPGELSASIPTGLLAFALSRVAFAVIGEESKFAIAGVLLSLNSKGFSVVATDGHRLGLSTHTVSTFNGVKDQKAIIPMKAVNELIRMGNKAEEDSVTHVYLGENHMYFHLGKRVLYSRTVSQKFPDYMRVFPTGQLQSVVLQSLPFRDAISRVARFSDERSRAIRFNLDSVSSTVTMSINTAPRGDGEETIDAAFTDAVDFQTGINADYLADVLKIAGSTPVKINFAPKQMIEVLIDGDSTYRHAIAPMTI